MSLVQDKNLIWVGAGASTDTYPETGYDRCFDIEAGSFWFRHRNRVILQAVANFPFKGNFADIGGGNGYQVHAIAQQFHDREAFLVEPGYAGCQNAIRRGVKNVYNVMFEEFPFLEKNIGAVGMFDVIEHIEDDVKFLSNLKSKVTPGTLVFITVPAYQWLWSDVDDFGHHFRRYTRQSLSELAERCSVEVLFNSYFFSYLVPLTFLLRHLPYRFGIRRSGEAIVNSDASQHAAGGVINSIFDILNKNELRILAQRKRILFGASCIAVFRV